MIGLTGTSSKTCGYSGLYQHTSMVTRIAVTHCFYRLFWLTMLVMIVCTITFLYFPLRKGVSVKTSITSITRMGMSGLRIL